MIYIKGQYNAAFAEVNAAGKPYTNSIYRDDLFKHADTEIAKRDKNKSGATFETNPLDWGAAIKIYKAATNSDKIVPVIMDTKAYHTGTQTTAKVPIVCADTSQRTDQEICEYIKEKVSISEKQELYFKIFQKIKIEQSIEVIEDEVIKDQEENEKNSSE